MASATIAHDEVVRIAELAHLELSAEELTRITRELGSILSYVQQLQELDLADVPPTAHVQIDRLPLREDTPKPSLPPEIALREAPEVEGGGFSVPAFVDEG